KGRMEVNDPGGNRTTSWFVTSGLLVTEMVTGQMQTGNATFEKHSPAIVPVAGDAGSVSAPTYASFSSLLGPAAKGLAVDKLIARDGTLSPLSLPGDPNLSASSAYDDVTKHNIPSVFNSWMHSSGTVLEDGKLLTGLPFDPLYVLGRPISEAYWADVPVNGTPTRVLMQLYERRALTYNPSNAPQWRVEMANVGRAYYSWRYGVTALPGAISGEVFGGILQVRGWNWAPQSLVGVEVDLGGATSPIFGPQSLQVDPAGRFVLPVALDASLQGALLSGANLQLRAVSGDTTAALPLATRLQTGKMHLEGSITQLHVALKQATMKTQGGQEWPLVFSANSQVHYSEGAPANLGAIIAGSYIVVDGSVNLGSLTVASLSMVSTSQTGAHLGIAWQSNGKSVRLTGTGWPAEQSVSLVVGHPNVAGGVQLAATHSDSRGNISLLVTVPLTATNVQGALSYGGWLTASSTGTPPSTSTGKGSIVAQVSVPLDPPASPTSAYVLPPTLSLLTQEGEQKGGLGSYCWKRMCLQRVGVPLPAGALQASPGDVLGFRSQYGPDPNLGPSPLSLSAQLYPYGSSLLSSSPDQVLYFAPDSQALFSTGDVPGRPFSVALPTTLAKGKYVLVVSVGWTSPSGGKEVAQYGFLLQLGL
ncbi:MAG: hypothetical protein M3014_12420, partial [Chloroflexota bacterium]|nr:hypothetical protein [Chloroflexota bacterium]